MKNPKQKRVHFMGIGGSGMSAVAILASYQGYQISGCDLQGDTPYLKKLKKFKVPLFIGHDPKHLKGVDILAITPAALFQNKKHPEIVVAKKSNKLMTWQKFLGKYLHKGKKVVCLAGTHGKSTTTAMASLLFDNAGKDPSVMIGATIKKWNSNCRFGKSEIFITEADEFFDNFLNYQPNHIVLNNIELDHPDYFESEEHVLQSFKKFVQQLTGPKTLIVNQDSPGIKKLFRILGKPFLNSIKVIGYSMRDKPLVTTPVSLGGKIISRDPGSTVFRAVSKELKLDREFKLRVPGAYNVANALGVIVLAKLFEIKTEETRKSLSSYSGIGRRLELIGTKNGIKVYDDYAHHPTAVSVTIEALRQQFPDQRIWVIVEPHSYSRTKVLLGKYKRAFDHADLVIIGPIFKARDTKTFGVSGQSIVDTAEHGKAKYIGDLDKITRSVKRSAKPGDVIVVMGAGMSYKWARTILEKL